MPDIQIILLAITLYLFIGMLVGIQGVLKYKLYKSEDPRISGQFLKNAVTHWPIHLFMMLGATIIRWKVKDEPAE